MVCDRHQHHGPVIGVIECPNVQSMKSHLPILDEFPCVNIPSNARDSRYQVVQEIFWLVILFYASCGNHFLRFCSMLRVGSGLAGRGCKNWNATMCCIISMVAWEDFSFKICTCNMLSHPLHDLMLHVVVIWLTRIPLYILTFLEVGTGAPGKFWTWLAFIYCWYLLFQGVTWWATG